MKPGLNFSLILTMFAAVLLFPAKGVADDICKAEFQHYNSCQITQQSDDDDTYPMICAEMQSVVMKAFNDTTSANEVSETVTINGTQTIWNCTADTQKMKALFNSGSCKSSSMVSNQSLPTLMITGDPEDIVNRQITD